MAGKKKLSSFAVNNIRCYGLVILAFLVLFPLQSAGVLSNSVSGQLVPICAYVVMAISLTSLSATSASLASAMPDL